jgi:hypothetical protein
MQASARRLKEVTAELKEAAKGTPRYYELIEEERFINKMLLVDEKISTVQHDIIEERMKRSNSCTQLLVYGRSNARDEHTMEGISGAKHDIEASIDKTMRLEGILHNLKQEREELINQRTESRALEATFAVQHTGR